MLSDKEIICPNNLLNVAHKKKGAVVGIVNAGKPLPMLSVMDAVHENLIIPILIGDKNCLLYTSPSPRDRTRSRMPSSA